MDAVILIFTLNAGSSVILHAIATLRSSSGSTKSVKSGPISSHVVSSAGGGPLTETCNADGFGVGIWLPSSDATVLISPCSPLVEGLNTSHAGNERN